MCQDGIFFLDRFFGWFCSFFLIAEKCKKGTVKVHSL